jgi:3-isopropylmalate/(R)-2-methylmalate dehydratase small subunit
MIAPIRQLMTQIAVLAEANIDTDVIFPARFLLITARAGMGDYLFHDRRFDAEGNPVGDFAIDRTPEAQALVVGDGFGTGSSREQAVWALVDHGIRVVIGTDFGDIFAGNARRNGLLLVQTSAERRDRIAGLAEAGAKLSLDVEQARLDVEGFGALPIDLSQGQREAFLNGWEEIDRMIQQESGYISAFEDVQRLSRPWLWEAG